MSLNPSRNIEAAAFEQPVHIIDDDEALRDSLVWLLESTGLKVASYPSAEAFLKVWTPQLRGCLVLDIRMPGMSGLELHEKLNSMHSTLPVIFITGHGDVPMAVTALKKGAFDFIEKPFHDQDMLNLIEQCLERDRAEQDQRRQGAEAQRRIDQLTPREREVLELIVAGRLNKQIADDLGISIKTVEVHRARVMEKMSADSLAELVQSVLHARGETASS
ncbi:response regulator transcription factor [Uliginosibacterium sediminicola]|uniref:Response regulator transcription factor n=1 Tax=Uliginosibacterium sediminicola TaxID=2024550 RepID=A0ABU9YWM2_9RHOO